MKDPNKELTSFGNATAAHIVTHTTTLDKKEVNLGTMLVVKINRLKRSGKKVNRLQGEATMFLPIKPLASKVNEEKFLKMLEEALTGLGLETKREKQPALHVSMHRTTAEEVNLAKAAAPKK